MGLFLIAWLVNQGIPVVPTTDLSFANTSILSVAFDSSGKKLAVAGTKGFFALMDVPGKKVIKQFCHPKKRDSYFVSFLNMDSSLLLAGDGKVLSEWNLAKEEELSFDSPFTIGSASLSKDQKVLATGTSTGKILIWDVKQRAVVKQIFTGKRTFATVIGNSNQWLALSSDTDKTVELWDIKTGTKLQELIGHNKGVQSLAFTPNGKVLASGGFDKTIVLWDTNKLEKLRSLQGVKKPISHLTYSANGKLLFAFEGLGVCRIWDSKSVLPLYSFKAHKSLVWCGCCSPDGSLLATCCIDGTVRVWAVESLHQVAEKKQLKEISTDESSEVGRVGETHRNTRVRFTHPTQQFNYFHYPANSWLTKAPSCGQAEANSIAEN